MGYTAATRDGTHGSSLSWRGVCRKVERGRADRVVLAVATGQERLDRGGVPAGEDLVEEAADEDLVFLDRRTRHDLPRSARRAPRSAPQPIMKPVLGLRFNGSRSGRATC